MTPTQKMHDWGDIPNNYQDCIDWSPQNSKSNDTCTNATNSTKKIHSLKLTYHLKIEGLITFLLRVYIVWQRHALLLLLSARNTIQLHWFDLPLNSSPFIYVWQVFHQRDFHISPSTFRWTSLTKKKNSQIEGVMSITFVDNWIIHDWWPKLETKSKPTKK